MGRHPTTTSVTAVSVKKPKIDYPKYLAVQLQEHRDIPVPIFEHRLPLLLNLLCRLRWLQDY